MNTDISERYRVAAALSVRVIVFSICAVEVTRFKRMRMHFSVRSNSSIIGSDGECNVDAMPRPRPGSQDGTYAGQGTQKEEASRSVGDSC